MRNYKPVFVLILVMCNMVYTFAQQKHTSSKNLALNQFKIDTTLRFTDQQKMQAYRVERDTKFWDYRKQQLAESNNNQEVMFKLDSFSYYNQDLFTYLVFKYLDQSKKAQTDLFLLNFNNSFSKLITPQDRIAMFNQFPESVRKTQQGLKMQTELNRQASSNPTKNISQIKSYTVETQKGKMIALKDLVVPGYEKYLIVFGASWCGPCRYENQLLVRNLSAIDTTRVRIINISVDESKDKWLKAVQQDNCPWAQVRVPGGLTSVLAKELGVDNSIPWNVLLNKNLNIEKQETNLELILPKIKS